MYQADTSELSVPDPMLSAQVATVPLIVRVSSGSEKGGTATL
jgi:hypothetical protein